MWGGVVLFKSVAGLGGGICCHHRHGPEVRAGPGQGEVRKAHLAASLQKVLTLRCTGTSARPFLGPESEIDQLIPVMPGTHPPESDWVPLGTI